MPDSHSSPAEENLTREASRVLFSTCRIQQPNRLVCREGKGEADDRKLILDTGNVRPARYNNTLSCICKKVLVQACRRSVYSKRTLRNLCIFLGRVVPYGGH